MKLNANIAKQIRRGVHLALGAHAREPVERAFDGRQHRAQHRPFTGEQTRHVDAQRLDAREHEREEHNGLQPSDGRHLKMLRTQHRVGQIGERRDGEGEAQCRFDHQSFSQPIA